MRFRCLIPGVCLLLGALLLGCEEPVAPPDAAADEMEVLVPMPPPMDLSPFVSPPDSSMILRLDGSRLVTSTLEEALAEAVTGETVVVAPGHHYGNFMVNRSITLRGKEASEEVILQGLNDSTLQLEAHGARVENMRLMPPLTQPVDFIAVTLTGEAKGTSAVDCDIVGGGRAAVVAFDNGRIRLLRCIVRDTLAGATIHAEGGEIDVLKCLVTNNHGVGVFFNQTKDSSVVGTEIVGSGRESISVRNGRGDILSCDMHDSEVFGVSVWEAGRATIANTAIHDVTGHALALQSHGVAKVTSCEIYDTTSDGVKVSTQAWIQVDDSEIHHLDGKAYFVFDEAHLTLNNSRVHHTQGGHTHYATTDVSRSHFHDNNWGIDYTYYGMGTVDKCLIEDSAGCGIHTRGCADPLITNSVIRRSNRHGFYSEYNGRGTAERCVFTDNIRSGVCVGETSYPVFVNCDISDNELAGVLSFDSNHAIFEECRITGNGASGFSTTDTSAPTLVACEIHDNDGYGIMVGRSAMLNSFDTVISGNRSGPWWIENTAQVTAPRNTPLPPTDRSLVGSRIVVHPTLVANFNTLTDAIFAAPEGAEIMLHPGTYRGRHFIWRDVAITAFGASSETVVVSPGMGNAISAVGAKVSLTGLTLRQEWPYAVRRSNTEQQSISAEVHTDDELWIPTIHFNNCNAEIVNCHIESANGPGITARGEGRTVRVSDSRITHTARGGLSIYPGITYTIENTEITDSLGSGLSVRENTRGTIDQVTISGHQHFGIHTREGATATVTDSQITDNGDGVMEPADLHTWTFTNTPL